MTVAAFLVGALVSGACLPWLVGRRRVRRTGSSSRAGVAALRVDVAVVCDLVASVLDAGASVPRALEVLGRALGGDDGRALRTVGAALLMGAPWAEAWEIARAAAARWDTVRRALEPAWVDGVAPGPTLRAAADGVRARRAEHAREAAERLGVRLVLPLGVCFLPAFVLLGLVPVVISTGGILLGA